MTAISNGEPGGLSRYSDSLRWTVRGSVGGEFFRTRSRPDLGPAQPPVQGYRVILGGGGSKAAGT